MEKRDFGGRLVRTKLFHYIIPIAFATSMAQGGSLEGITPYEFSGRVSNSSSLSIRAKGSYSPVDGQMQISRDGKLKTSTSGRPTLEEIGIDYFYSYGGGIEIASGSNTIDFDVDLAEASGEAKLEKDVVSRNRYFQRDFPVSSDLNVDTFKFTYLRSLFEKSTMTASLGVAVGALNIDYELRARYAEAGYSETEWFAGLVGKVEIPITKSLSMGFEGQLALPFSNTPEVNRASVRLESPLSNNVLVYAGVGFENLDYEDDKTVPNHIEIERFPMTEVGFKYSF
jgi:hypothetical protein